MVSSVKNPQFFDEKMEKEEEDGECSTTTKEKSKTEYQFNPGNKFPGKRAKG